MVTEVQQQRMARLQEKHAEGFGSGGNKSGLPTPMRDRCEAITKRTYKQSVVHLLESEYKILGSHRVLDQLADDLEQLHRSCYGNQEKMAPGTLCWRTQSLEDQTIT